MKIFFALTMLASASARLEHKAAPFGDDQRELQTCTCSAAKAEVDNCGFIYDDDTGVVTACVRRSVVASSDDAEEEPSGIMNLDSDDLDMVDNGFYDYIGIRFRDISIPQDAEIVSARIVFIPDDDDSGTTSLTIQGEDEDDAGTFTSTSHDISSRSFTSNQVNWNNIPAWTAGEQYETPDLSSIVQEIVDRAGWSSGNALAFILQGTGNRDSYSFDGAEIAGDAWLAPELVIEFRTTGGTPDESIFERNGNTARLIGASGYPNKNWKLRGYPQGSQGDEAILPGVKYPLPYDGSSYPGKLNIKIKVAASRQWLDVNSRAKFQYRLYDCPGDCTPTAWTRVINFDNDGTNQPPREGSATDRDDDDGFFERTLELFTDGCKNLDYEQIEFQIVNTKAANTGNNDKDFFVRQFYMNTVGCH